MASLYFSSRQDQIDFVKWAHDKASPQLYGWLKGLPLAFPIGTHVVPRDLLTELRQAWCLWEEEVTEKQRRMLFSALRT